jgi:hypothetical protein
MTRGGEGEAEAGLPRGGGAMVARAELTVRSSQRRCCSAILAGRISVVGGGREVNKEARGEIF